MLRQLIQLFKRFESRARVPRSRRLIKSIASRSLTPVPLTSVRGYSLEAYIITFFNLQLLRSARKDEICVTSVNELILNPLTLTLSPTLRRWRGDQIGENLQQRGLSAGRGDLRRYYLLTLRRFRLCESS